MSAYLIVEFTVKDPDVYRENTLLALEGPQKSTEPRLSQTVTGNSCTAMARSPLEHSCGFPTMSRPSSGTTRRNISS